MGNKRRQVLNLEPKGKMRIFSYCFILKMERRKRNSFSLLLFCALFIASIESINEWQTTTMNTGWELQSSAVLGNENGEKISQLNFNAASWYPVTLPATVVAGLVQNGVYEDPFYGLNLLKINKTQFTNTWWYRSTFNISQTLDSLQSVIIRFKGINYRANIWLNGQQIAHENDVVGTFRYFEFDITKYVTQSNNVIALQLYEPVDYWTTTSTTDLAISFVDWSPYAPDCSMGIWRDVELSILPGTVKLAYPMVATILSNNNQDAHLTVATELTNYGTEEVTGVLSVNLSNIGSFTVDVTIKSGDTLQLVYSNSTYSVLNVNNPTLWWPWQMGESFLYNLNITFTVNGELMHTISAPFGIREMTSSLDEANFRFYSVNGQKILVRGAGWAPDLFLRASKERHEAELNYVRHMNLNAIRLEGKMNDDYFFELADQLGILILPGWCCCDSWQHWDEWKEEEYHVAIESMSTQLKRLRIHPSILVFLYSSDDMPPERVELDYLQVAQDTLWPNPLLSSASNLTSSITGPTGVKMSGPYSYEPPIYWYNLELGGAFAFLTEGGPGENPMTLESLERTIPSKSLWPINFEWDYHCGNQDGLFGSLKYFTPPLNTRMGETQSAADYLVKSQAMAYESHRAFFEAYSRNKYTSTGLIQWMLNNAFPENIWHLYDYYLNPGGTYFGTKIACEPIHILYSYNDSTIWVVNSMYEEYTSLTATMDIFAMNGTNVFSYNQSLPSLAPDSPVYLYTLPDKTIYGLSSVYFVRLAVLDSLGNYQSLNVYWLGVQMDFISSLDYDASTFYRTPVSVYADLTPLQDLPELNVTVSITKTTSGSNTIISHVVSNPNNAVAFQVRLRVVNSSTGIDILPVFWDDNYITMFPYETRTINATIATSLLSGVNEETIVEIYNNIAGK